MPDPQEPSGLPAAVHTPTLGVSDIPVPGVVDAFEPPPPQLSNSAAAAISTAFFGMFVLLMHGAALNKRVFVSGSPSMSLLVIYFAPSLQITLAIFEYDHWNRIWCAVNDASHTDWTQQYGAYDRDERITTRPKGRTARQMIIPIGIRID
jgi:hypothetical protein